MVPEAIAHVLMRMTKTSRHNIRFQKKYMYWQAYHILN